MLLFIGIALEPGRFDRDPFSSIENPVGIGGGKTVFSAIGDSGWGLFLVVMLASAISLVLRFRRARSEEREQVKWIAAAAALLVALWATAFAVGFGTINANLLQALFFAGVAFFPVSIGFAILKYRLYEIDRIINRTLVYGAVTALLAGLYFAIVIGLQAIFSGFTRGNDLAIAGSTLAVAALFRPARARIQAFVDHRFYRRRYDAQQTSTRSAHDSATRSTSTNSATTSAASSARPCSHRTSHSRSSAPEGER